MPRRRMQPMRFDLRRPCVECPFLATNNLYLRPGRAEEIAEGLEHNTFQCHMAPEYHCAGSLVIMARNKAWGDMQQIAWRIGLFDPDVLDLNAQVFDSFGDFVRFYGGEVRNWVRGRRRV